MRPLYEDPHFTFRFADDRIIPRFHLEGVEAGRQVSVFRIDPGTSWWSAPWSAGTRRTTSGCRSRTATAAPKAGG